MPLLTDVQEYAANLLRKLQCVRHDQIHWMISRAYPAVKPEKIMRQVSYLLRCRSDKGHYLWFGSRFNAGRVAAVDIMLETGGTDLPLFDTCRYPCNLIFFTERDNRTQAVRVYTPRSGDEAQCREKAEATRDPRGHATVFYIESDTQIPCLKISRPHIFAIRDGAGGYVSMAM